ncbi:amino acid permease [Enterococcus sp. BWR-S5]|uniref:amino acid permease n=1 Tax=Enterococcus sp. BWR-S5 TaxID=2787714 RepID=UPI00192041CA|nr:amino acid permease [Enterococcus sp. BWR-S5]MBL1224871.1 amino acid permease [Enterococcus sp. BWR-S5]
MSKNNQLFSSKRLVMIITTTVFSFSSLTTAFFLMGMKALPYFIWAAAFYFIPYALIISEFTAIYKNDSGGLYKWLSDCLSERTAFIAAFLWYCSYFVWMISLFMKLWIPLSLLLFGKDLTKQPSPIPFVSTTQLIGFLSILAVCFTLFIVSKGFKQIAYLLYASSVLMFLLVFISFSSNFILWLAHPEEITIHLLSSIRSVASTSQNTVVSQLTFLIFAVTAFGGLDTIASLVDKTGQQKKRFSKLVIFSSVLIVICYFMGLLLWSGALNWQELQKDQSLHLGNLMYTLMNESGQRVAESLGGTIEINQFIGQLFTRLTALTLLISYIALLSSIFYLPLRVLVEGTPKHYWPSWVRKRNTHNIPANALLVQGGLIILFISMISWGNSYVTLLYNQLTMMTNISRALPYLLVALAYPAFKRKYSEQTERPPYRVKLLPYFLSASVALTIAVSIFSQLYLPLIEKEYTQMLSLAIGPLFFAGIGAWLYQRFFRKGIVNQ